MQPNKPIGKYLAILLAALLLPQQLRPQTLTYSDHEPLGGMRTRFINDVLFPAIAKESDGRLKIEAHWGGELSNGYDALRNVGKERKADMAIVVPEYASDALPLNQIFKKLSRRPCRWATGGLLSPRLRRYPGIHDEELEEKQRGGHFSRYRLPAVLFQR